MPRAGRCCMARGEGDKGNQTTRETLPTVPSLYSSMRASFHRTTRCKGSQGEKGSAYSPPRTKTTRYRDLRLKNTHQTAAPTTVSSLQTHAWHAYFTHLTQK